MRSENRISAQGIRDIMRLSWDPRHGKAEVQQLLSDPDEALVVQGVQRLVEDAHQRPVVRPDGEVWETSKVEF